MALATIVAMQTLTAQPDANADAPPWEKEGRLPALRWYPSAHLPPVSEPYMFCWYFGDAPDMPGAVSNTQGCSKGAWVEIAQQGKLPLNWFYGPQCKYRKSAQEVIDAYLSTAQSGRLGIMVDEWQAPKEKVDPDHPLHVDNPFGITGSIQGMVKAKRLNPALFIGVAWRGESSIAPAMQAHMPDLLMVEGYSHLHKKFPANWGIGLDGVKKRIDAARELGVIDRTVPWLGMILAPEDYNEAHEALTAEQVEAQVAELRRHAPEMPGVIFYRNSNPELARACEHIMRKYFVDPAPEVRLTTPRFEQNISGPRVLFKAEAEGRDGRAIHEYRWFVDNRWIARTEEDEYTWDSSRVAPGRHIITVHAVDSGWNRAAAQVPVTLDAPGQKDDR